MPSELYWPSAPDALRERFDPLLDDTPIARAARQALEVRNGDLTMPRPRVPPGDRRRQSEGRRRQDHHHGQHRRRPGAGRPRRAGHRPGPAGQHQHRARRGPDRRHAVHLRRPLGEITVAEAIQTCPDAPRLGCIPATIDLAGAEIELVSMVPREYRLQAGARRRSTASSTTSSSTARRRSGLLTVNAMVAASEVLIPIQCEYYALEGLGQLLSNIELIKAHLNPELDVSAPSC